jgi:hypothetical protein
VFTEEKLYGIGAKLEKSAEKSLVPLTQQMGVSASSA